MNTKVSQTKNKKAITRALEEAVANSQIVAGKGNPPSKRAAIYNNVKPHRSRPLPSLEKKYKAYMKKNPVRISATIRPSIVLSNSLPIFHKKAVKKVIKKPVVVSASVRPMNNKLLTIRLHSFRAKQKSIETIVADLKKEVAELRKELKSKQDKMTLRISRKKAISPYTPLISLKEAKKIYKNSPFFKPAK